MKFFRKFLGNWAFSGKTKKKFWEIFWGIYIDMNLKEQTYRIKKIMGISESFEDGEFKRTNLGASFRYGEMVMNFDYSKNSLDCDDNLVDMKPSSKSPNEIADFIHMALIKAKENGFNSIKNINISMGSDKRDAELLNALKGGNRFIITKGKDNSYNFALQEMGKSFETPLSIQNLVPSEGVTPPKYLLVYHATVQLEDKFNFDNVSDFQNGLHVGTYKSAAERVGMSVGNSISGLGRLVNVKEKPRLYRLIIDTEHIANMDKPIRDYDVDLFMSKHKGEYDGVAYINSGEDVGSVSLVIWKKTAIVSADKAEW